jgi:hypothetical protein
MGGKPGPYNVATLVDRRIDAVELVLDKGATYTVVVASSAPGMPGRFFVTATTEHKMIFEQVKSKPPKGVIDRLRAAFLWLG